MSLDACGEDICAEDVCPDAYAEDPRPEGCADGWLEAIVVCLVTGDGLLEVTAEDPEGCPDCLSMSAIRGAAGPAVSTMFLTPWVLMRSCSPTAAMSC